MFPAVAMPTSGDLTYADVAALLHGLAARGHIVSLILAVFAPERDEAHRLCALIAARLGAVENELMWGAETAAAPDDVDPS